MSLKIVTHTMTRDQREEILDRAGRHLSLRPEILFAYAHGSFLQEPFFRDLDVAVFVDERPKGLRTFYELNLEEELEKNLQVPFPVDVRVLNGAPLSFQYKAIRGRLLLDRAPQTRVDFCVRVMSRYFDIRPLLVHSLKEAFGNGTGP